MGPAIQMPTGQELLRACAITAYFGDCPGIDLSVHRLVFAFSNGLPQIAASRRGQAFALRTGWGSVVTWGDAESGGDSSGVAAQLSGGVQSVTGNVSPFAAAKSDGSVVTWGHAAYGGDSSDVAAELSGCAQCVTASARPFAAETS